MNGVPFKAAQKEVKGQQSSLLKFPAGAFKGLPFLDLLLCLFSHAYAICMPDELPRRTFLSVSFLDVSGWGLGSIPAISS